MSRFASFLAAGLVGLGCGVVALGGQTDPFGLTKAASVAIVSAYIVLLLCRGWANVSEVMDEAYDLEENLGQQTTQIPSLRKLELSALSRGNLPGVAERVAEQFCSNLSEKVSFARWVAAVSVYIGLGGTLIGLTCAVFGLRNLNSDPEILKNQILSVVSGFGGSFACALCGIVATVLLSFKLSEFDALVQSIEDLAETHVSEVVFKEIPTGDDRLATLVGQAVGQSLERVTEVWETFRATAEKFESAGTAMSSAADQMNLAADRLASQTEMTDDITKELSWVSANTQESSKTCAEASQHLKDVVLELLPAFRALRTGIEALQATLSTLSPAIESAHKLEKTVNTAEDAVQNLNARVAGIAGAVREEVKLASDSIVEYHQNALNEGITPSLRSLTRSMDLLVLIIDKADQLLHNLPVAISAKRIIDDLEAAGVVHLAASERDAKLAEDSVNRLGDAESKVNDILTELRNAHEKISDSLKEIEQETTSVLRNVNEVSEYVEQPFWKKLGGRKP